MLPELLLSQSRGATQEEDGIGLLLASNRRSKQKGLFQLLYPKNFEQLKQASQVIEVKALAAVFAVGDLS